MTSEEQLFIGIDPGASGGLACLDRVGHFVLVEKMPETPGDILSVVHLMLAAKPMAPAFAYLEKVSTSPQMGVASAGSFMRNVGRLETALAAAHVPYDWILPTRWQTVLGCRTGGGKFGQRDATAAKNLTKARAQQLWPAAKITHAIADALLLAEFCRRSRLGLIAQ